MTHGSLETHTTTALLDDEQDVLRSATCPMCHAPASLTQSALAAGGDWQCVRCGQHWDAARLAAVAAYAAWVVELEQRRLRERTAVKANKTH
jgi:ribosomal protein L37AE/L43A